MRHLQQLVRALWRDAELTHWRPGFEGRRSWATVRRHLLAISAMEDPDNEVLRSRLYVPEFFRVDDREAIRARRLEAWRPARESTVGDGAGMFMIGEFKRILPRSQDFEVIVKHVPDEAFAIANDLYRWLSENLAAELHLWATSEEVRMIVVAWFCVAPSGAPVIEALVSCPCQGNGCRSRTLQTCIGFSSGSEIDILSLSGDRAYERRPQGVDAASAAREKMRDSTYSRFGGPRWSENPPQVASDYSAGRDFRKGNICGFALQQCIILTDDNKHYHPRGFRKWPRCTPSIRRLRTLPPLIATRGPTTASSWTASLPPS